jgi:putative SOS response-associated peptidase YedK
MCGRLSQYRGIQDFVAALSMPIDLLNGVGDQAIGRYNAGPATQLALLHQQGEYLRADMVRWGWRPQWARSGAEPFNAQVEKVAHRPFFRAAWPHRAIIAIDNWFEWVNEGGSRTQPYLIRRRDQTPIFCAAIGRYPQTGHPPAEQEGFVLITADNAGGMLDIHDRRPVTLAPALAREWLNPGTFTCRAEQMVLRQGEPSEAFEWFRVDHAVSNVLNQQRGLILPRPTIGSARLNNG